MTLLFVCKHCRGQFADLSEHQCPAKRAADDLRRLNELEAVRLVAPKPPTIELNIPETAAGRELARSKLPAKTAETCFDRNAYHKAYMRAYMRGWRARRKATGP